MDSNLPNRSYLVIAYDPSKSVRNGVVEFASSCYEAIQNARMDGLDLNCDFAVSELLLDNMRGLSRQHQMLNPGEIAQILVSCLGRPCYKSWTVTGSINHPCSSADSANITSP